MILLVGPALVNHVKVIRLIHGHVMGRLPAVLVRQLRPGMIDPVLVFTFPQDQFAGFGSASCQHGWCHGRSRRRQHELAPRELNCFLFHSHELPEKRLATGYLLMQ